MHVCVFKAVKAGFLLGHFHGWPFPYGFNFFKPQLIVFVCLFVCLFLVVILYKGEHFKYISEKNETILG